VDSKVSSAAEVYKPNDGPEVNETSELLWKGASLPDISSPDKKGKLSNAIGSSGCVGVYKAELSGLVDLSVLSDWADDMWYDICETLGYMATDPVCS
jgi:hypothetical protein